MLKRIATGLAVLMVVSSIALAVVPAIRAQVLPERSKPRIEQLSATPPANLGYEIVRVGPVVAAVNGGIYQVVDCPSGKKVVGGGFTVSSGTITWSSSGPSGSTGNNAWMVAGRTASSTPASAVVYAICIIAS